MNWLKKASNIISSRLKKTEKTEWASKRLDICKICIHNSDNSLKKTRKEKFMIWANKAANSLLCKKVSSDAICNICYCNLILKTSEQGEECGLAFAGEDPKWTSILPTKNK